MLKINHKFPRKLYQHKIGEFDGEIHDDEFHDDEIHVFHQHDE